jgi:hypothetical protein
MAKCRMGSSKGGKKQNLHILIPNAPRMASVVKCEMLRAGGHYDILCSNKGDMMKELNDV